MTTTSEQKLGLSYGISAYTIWGLFPLFFYLLRFADPFQTLTQRVIWCFVVVAGLALGLGRWQPVINALRSPALKWGLMISSLLISTNWLIFIWAINRGYMLECSLGYFLTPLVSVLVARVFLQEAIDRYRWIAIGLASIGVIWQVISLGHLPWISISLALSFGFYGLARKKIPVDALSGLLLETLFLMPIALLYVAWLSANGTNQFFTQGWHTTALFMGCGVVTAMPLLLFAAAAQRLSLTALGFMIYINPTLQFLLAIFVFKQHFNTNLLISFGFIWAALTVFSLGALRQAR